MKITDPEKLRRRALPALVAHPEAVPLDFLELDIAQAAIPGTDRTSYTMLRALTTLRGMRPELILREEMAPPSNAYIVRLGRRRRVRPPAVGQELAARMPHARIETLSDTGHLPHVERPDTVAAAINGFLGHEPTA